MADNLRFGFMGRKKDDAEFGRACEDFGASLMAWGESSLQFPDPYLQMLRVAQKTQRLMMGTVVTCPGLRHPATHANTLRELQRLSNGRMFCGIGCGDLGLIELGERPYKMDDFVAYATAVRDLVAGREVKWNGHELKLRTEATQPVPFWFGADGPRGIRTAGQCADGIIVAQVGSADVVRTAIQRLKAGAEEAGRSFGDLDIWFMLRVMVTDKPDGAVDIHGLDEYATRALRFIWRTAGKPARDEVAPALLKQRGLVVDPQIAGRLYDFNQRWDQSRAFDSKYHVALMDELGLRSFAGRYFYKSGSPDHIARTVQELVDAGARNFIIPSALIGEPGEARQIAGILKELRTG